VSVVPEFNTSANRLFLAGRRLSLHKVGLSDGRTPDFLLRSSSIVLLEITKFDQFANSR
jgi:hypothetical protein